VHAFRIPHALHIIKQFSKSLGISNKLLSLGFGILLLRWILLAFQMSILLKVVLTKRAILVPAIFSDPLLFAGLLKNNLQLLNPPQRLSMQLLLDAAPKSYGLCTPRNFGVVFERVPLMCDTITAISVAKNLVFDKRMKHLKVRHHFLRDHVEKRDIEMRYIDTERQLADIFTKPLDASRFAALQGEIGVFHPYGLI
jgi:hypothetical protein